MNDMVFSFAEPGLPGIRDLEVLDDDSQAERLRDSGNVAGIPTA